MSASHEKRAEAAALRRRVVDRWNVGDVTLAQLAIACGLSGRGVAGRIISHARDLGMRVDRRRAPDNIFGSSTFWNGYSHRKVGVMLGLASPEKVSWWVRRGGVPKGRVQAIHAATGMPIDKIPVWKDRRLYENRHPAA